MDPRRLRTYRIIALDLLLMLIGISNIPTVVDRARLPASCTLQGSRTVVVDVEAHPGVAFLRPGDILLAWNDIRIVRPEHVEFLGDRSHIGETVALTVERDGSLLTVPASLVSFTASLRFALVHTITGLVVFALAMFLMLKRPDDASALALHRTLVALGALIMLTQGALDASEPASYVRRAGLFLAYALTPAWFLGWTLRFPVRWLRERRWPGMVLTAIAFVFAVVLSSTHLPAIVEGSPEWFDAFQEAYEWFHLYFAVLIVAGLVMLGVGYVVEADPDRRRALRWVLWGMLIGTTPFTLFVVLPQAFGPEFFLTEEIGTAFALAIPVSLTVAFLRYHVFDVEVGLHRRLASRVLDLVTGSLTVLAGLVIVSLAWEGLVFDEHFEAALAIAIVVLALQPARARLRRLFEESLLPVRGALAEILQRAEARFQQAMSPDQLGSELLHELTVAIPGVTWIWIRRERAGHLSPMMVPGEPPAIISMPDAVRAGLQPRTVIARPGATRQTRGPVPSSVIDWLSDRSADLAAGLHDESGDLMAVMLGQRNVRRDILSSEETRAIVALCALAAGSLGRLQLQEAVFIEQQERRRSEELSRQRSRFVSSVSHDLRTPLTSIKMFAELLQDARLPADRRQEYAEIIARESQRLGRMVNNVLDFARIERGAREYVLKPVDLRRVLEAAVAAMLPQAASLDGSLTLRLPKRLPPIHGDADALQDVVHNLIGNALKYSRGRRKVTVEAMADADQVTVRVRDNGIGIAPEHLQEIFDPFYRVKDPRAAQTGGAGLGLAIVKHAIEAHGGTIRVESVVGKGTTVILQVPVLQGSGPD